jgi:hypothetical protein
MEKCGAEIPRHPPLPSESCVIHAYAGMLGGRSSDSQASYSLLLPSSGLNQCLLELSFLFTAAGQFRVLTGFPIRLMGIIRHHKVPRI